MFWLCVAVRIIANPLSNVLQKLLTREHASPLFVIGIAHGLLSLVCVPVLVMNPPPVSLAFWLNMSASVVLAVAGNVLIVEALKISDLSILGPVNAYKSLVSLLPGIVLLHEIPSAGSLAGLGLIIAGSYLIVDRPEGSARSLALGRLFSDRGVQYRLGGLVLSASEAVFLKRALAAASPAVTFAVWSCAGFAIAVIAAVATARRSSGGELRIGLSQRWTCVGLAATTGLMQLCTLVILTGFQVAPALALFQTSTLLAVMLGRKVFHEPHFARRLLGSAVMVTGAMLIVVSR
jgi:drug/metabolite transporter (DMT)-like permease